MLCDRNDKIVRITKTNKQKKQKTHATSYIPFKCNTFVQQGHIKLIKSDSKDFSFCERILNKMYENN